MVRIAEAIARREGCAYLLTGESLGQVSSQTLQNLRAIDAAASMVVLRPLIGFDKDETVRIAREIGTFAISEGPEICDLLGPAHPATKASLDQVLAEEARVDVDRLVRDALAGAYEERLISGRGRCTAPHMTDYLLEPCRNATALISTLQQAPRRPHQQSEHQRLLSH